MPVVDNSSAAKFRWIYCTWKTIAKSIPDSENFRIKHKNHSNFVHHSCVKLSHLLNERQDDIRQHDEQRLTSDVLRSISHIGRPTSSVGGRIGLWRRRLGVHRPTTNVRRPTSDVRLLMSEAGWRTSDVGYLTLIVEQRTSDSAIVVLSNIK